MTRRAERGLGVIAVILALLIAAVLYLGYFQMQSMMRGTKTTVTAIDTSRAFACRTNRQTVEREIQMWLVNHPGETPTFAALEADGAHIPSCPEGGTYSLDGLHVRCSKHD
jgi:type II secretory pathway component PulJ